MALFPALHGTRGKKNKMQHHVTLINPAINSESQNPVINSVINKMIPSSLGYIAGYVREAGLSDVRIHDEQFGKLSDGEIEEIIGELAEPRIVGLLGCAAGRLGTGGPDGECHEQLKDCRTTHSGILDGDNQSVIES